MKSSLQYLFLGLSLCNLGTAASTVVNWSTNRELNNFNDSIRLSAGTSSDGDGTLLQLGYFDQATPASPFAGNWVTIAVSTIGDQGDQANGFFMITTIFESGDLVEPVIGTPLGVRYFDGTSAATSSYFNTAVNEDGSGLWQGFADTPTVVNLQLAKGVSEFEDSLRSFSTSIPIPEPSLPALILLSLGLLMHRKRK